MNDDTNQRAREDTVAFVQDWLMSSDYEPTQWDRDFAAAIDARATSVREEALREAAERITAFQALIARDSEFYEGGFSALNDALEIIKDVRDGLSLITEGGGRG